MDEYLTGKHKTDFLEFIIFFKTEHKLVYS